jgi:hypothetical protein
MTEQFEEYEMPDYEHDTTADDVLDAVSDSLHEYGDWVKDVRADGSGRVIVEDVNGLRFLVKVEPLSGAPS